MRYPSLDARLSCAAELFPACEYGADIGADHGRLSCYLLANQQCARMCVTDLSADSLQKAQKLLKLHGLSDRADFSVGDGLEALLYPCEAIAILGMGGSTLSHILLKGKAHLHQATLVLSAHTDLMLVRQSLVQLSYHLVAERVVLDAGRYYVVMQAKSGEEDLSERQLFLGPRLMEQGGSGYLAYLAWRIGVTACEKTEKGRMRLHWLKEEYELACNRTDDRRHP